MVIDKAGYISFNRVYQHREVAEKALGRKLTGSEEVHHIDFDTSNNKNENLVICPNHEYHMLLHIRTLALNATGNADHRKCRFCKKFDDTSMLSFDKANKSYYHKICMRDIRRIYRNGGVS
jgi:hypothetical protein